MSIGRCDYDSMRSLLDRLLRAMGGSMNLAGPTAPGVWSPPTDVFETASGVVVKMEVPGVRAADLSIVLVDDRLWVRGVRADPDEGKLRYQQMEIAYGPFMKVVQLGRGFDQDGIEATLKDGYLKLTIPRSSAPPPEKIAVEIRL